MAHSSELRSAAAHTRRHRQRTMRLDSEVTIPSPLKVGARATRWCRLRFALAGLVVMAATRPTSGQQPRLPPSSPDTVRLAADMFFRAVADERWQTAAAMMDTTLMQFVVAQRLRWQPQIAS